ncbi:DUF3632 domain-containing protein, partial [Saccharopolyspora sp. NPDC047091]|uniref:DUF3632 domain-containing protein n=1 Tax=Saccharopolyspora sp. NPDC047091 TaxID=3155924 RepID=UPI0033F21765
ATDPVPMDISKGEMFRQGGSSYPRLVRLENGEATATSPRGAPPAEGAARFAAPVRDACTRRRGEDAIAAILWAAWHPVLTAARTAPATQPRLVALVAAVRDLGPLPGRNRVWGLEVFTDLPCFGALLRETWDADPAGQVPLAAFAARLTSSGIDFSLHALWALREHLEHPDPPRDLGAVLSWARHAGPVLAEHARTHRVFADHDRGPDRLGPLALSRGIDGHGFSPARWAFWRTRLAELGTPDSRAALDLLPPL